MKHFFFLFGQKKPGDHLFEFSIGELKSVAKTLNIVLKIKDNDINSINNLSYAIIELESCDHVKMMLPRLILCKCVIELWGQGASFPDLNRDLKQNLDDEKLLLLKESVSFCMRVKGIMKKVSMAEQRQKMEMITDEAFPVKGNVNLKAPDQEYYLFEDYTGLTDNKYPKFLFFGRLVGEGPRKLLDTYALPKRKFIGNTSMEPEMSFFMANVAQVVKGSFVLDPFVGSGSILVSAAHFGGYVCGSDINYNIVHAVGKSSKHNVINRAKDESILTNLKQYGLQDKYIDILVADAAKHPWKTAVPIFDAIITDPPYGIRESSRKVGHKKEDMNAWDDCAQHYPEKKQYHLDQVFKDLLNFSAASLVVGGRLVYFLPVNRNEYTDDFVPKHPSLTLVGNYEQVLNTHSSRRLIVMEKTANSIESHQSSINSDFYTVSNSFRNFYFNGK